MPGHSEIRHSIWWIWKLYLQFGRIFVGIVNAFVGVGIGNFHRTMSFELNLDRRRTVEGGWREGRLGKGCRVKKLAGILHDFMKKAHLSSL